MVTTGMTVMMVVHILIVAIMIGLILLQKSEGGALGMGGGGFMTARGTANLLTRSTAVFAGLFFVSTIVLALMFKGSTESESILDRAPSVPVAAESSSTRDAAPVQSDAPVNR